MGGDDAWRASTPQHKGFVDVGRPEDLDALIREYGLDPASLEGNTFRKIHRWTLAVAGTPIQEEHAYIHTSLLRPHGQYPAAADRQATEYLDDVVADMVDRFGISRNEAVARVNRHFEDPRTLASEDQAWRWIVGSDIVYHELPDYWACAIYYEPGTPWWQANSNPQPLPPPNPR